MYETLIKRAIRDINSTTYGKFLMEQFPVHITSATSYPDENKVLKKYGSPACTDGKAVYVSVETTENFFENVEFKQWDTSDVGWQTDYEELWTKLKLKDETMKMDERRKTEEIKDILLHEFTHAVNEHPKLQRAAKNKSKEYQKRLQIACELQANDGIMGRQYASNYSQQPDGVTNKRQHPETIHCHTLDEFIRKIVLPPEMQMPSSAGKSGDAQQEMMETTGVAQQVDREIEMERKDAEETKDTPGGGIGGENNDRQTTDERVAKELRKIGQREIKKFILAALSDELKYDPLTDSVVLNKVIRKVEKKTYSRISSRQATYASMGSPIIRKGVKRERIKEYNKANDLTIIAVDASGSMGNQQDHVAALLNDLLRQVGDIAKREKIDVHWDNLLGMEHTNCATGLYPVTSQRWKDMMDDYYANGGNDFDCVLRKVNDEKLSGDHKYDSVTIINLSDGMDEMNSDFSGMPVHDYIKTGRLKWVDALIGNPHDLARANWCATHDYYQGLRKQIVLHVED